MKKIALSILPILLLASCNSPAGTNVVNSTIFSEPAKLQGYKLNAPNKPFNSKPAQAINADYLNSLREFAIDFIQETYKEEMYENPVFSPMSISTCYSMAVDAATGKTKEELDDLIHFDDASFNRLEEVKNALLKTAINDPENDTYLNLSQSVWIDRPDANAVQNDYLKILEDYYFAEAYGGVLSQMANEFAAWINSKTNNYLNVKGQDFEEMLASAILVLVNTLYLKASWVTAFEEAANTEWYFSNYDSTTSKATFMVGGVEEGYYYKADNYKITSIPFRDGLEFRVLLPNSNVSSDSVLNDRTALSNLLTLSLNEESRDANGYVIKNSLTYMLPQFKVRTKYNLVDMFRAMGAPTPFNSGTAEFPQIDPAAFIASSIHEAGFEINNKGGEGAAYTIIAFGKGGGPSGTEFTFDHPFAYAVTTEDGIPLFMGKVTKF